VSDKTVVSTSSTDGTDVVSTSSTDGTDVVPTSSTDPVTPFLRVVKGDPTPEELAALVTVLASLGGPPDSAPRRTPEWNAPGRLHRVPQAHGADGWRSSGLPR
jgi:hypothetical protein